MKGSQTTRRHPRTLGEAFRGAEYAQPFWHATPERRAGRRLLNAALAVAIGVGLAMTLAYGPGGL